MKQIPMTELKEGDVFAFEVKLKGREAYLVESNNGNEVVYSKRNANKYDKNKSMKVNGHVLKLNNL